MSVLFAAIRLAFKFMLFLFLAAVFLVLAYCNYDFAQFLARRY